MINRDTGFVLGAQCWICQIFPGGRFEVPRRRWDEVWGGVSLYSLGRGLRVPVSRNFLVFDLKMVNFLVYSDAINLKFFVKQKLKYIWNRAFQPSVFGALPILDSWELLIGFCPNLKIDRVTYENCYRQ